MSTTTRSREALLIGLCLVPLLYLASIWNSLPPEVPTHFDTHGQPNGYSSRKGFFFLIAIISLLQYPLLRALPHVDPNKKLGGASYERIRLIITLFFALLATLLVYLAHTKMTGGLLTTLLLSTMSLLMAALGNVILTVPQNYFVGIRTPWTLASEANWRKTHRLGGRLWLVGGLVAFVAMLVLPDSWKFPVFMAIVGLLTMIPVGYSYNLFRKGLATVAILLLSVGTSAWAQTEETLRYAITQPANVSLTLEGTLTLPPGARKPVPVVMLIAGSGPTDRNSNSAIPGYDSINTFRQLAEQLASQGVAVFRYDKRGTGTNRAAFIAQMQQLQRSVFDDAVADAVGFIRQLQADKRFSRVIVAGHSEGSLVGMLAARQAKASGFISIAGAGQNIAEVIKTQFRASGAAAPLVDKSIAGIDSLKSGFTVRTLPLMPVPPSQQGYLTNWMKYDPAVEIKAFAGPVLIIQGKRDIQVAVSEAELLKKARPDAKLALFDSMSHILKEAPTDRAANLATYKNAKLTLIPGVADVMAAFAKGK
ncbi:alpha/beta fold hydrolase [Fibrella sp. HMF5335]|uniref:Alpha/beta fold hydrolase n=1 Tax=Fibrella rubiginis TaxID=2817060 RepID=A0A939GNW0_9BACT|nr:alpha/beta fold hydrolase [Fibrella rubiginis]MBO0939917.1 alpha/beta fold hydrolase [Fibrella rubiginis]